MKNIPNMGAKGFLRHSVRIPFLQSFFLLLLTVIPMSNAWCITLALSPSVVGELLSESDPTAFAPNEFSVSDFQVKPTGEANPDITATLISNSLQWVRVQEVLVLPRARLQIEVQNLESGQVVHGDFRQPMEVIHHHGQVEIPVALITGNKNPIQIHYVRNGKKIQAQFEIEFKRQTPPLPYENGIYWDSSCSKFQLTFEAPPLLKHWAYIGCRQVRTRGQNSRAPSLEMFIFWDGVGQTLEVDNVDTPSSALSIWALRLRSRPGKVTLRTPEGEKFKVEYRLPEVLHDTFIGMGLGPYSFQLQGGSQDVKDTAVFVNLYMSRFMTESFRLVAFGSTAIHGNNFTDLGVYLSIEQFRFLDRRLGINLLIGAHGVGFQADGPYTLVPSFPQGFEIDITDAFGRGKRLIAGAFIYPVISGNSYYNAWLRWGTQYFIEANYFSWQVQSSSNLYRSTSYGLTFGFPLARFW